MPLSRARKVAGVCLAMKPVGKPDAGNLHVRQEIEEKLGRRGLKSRIHRRAYRNRKLSEAQKAANAMRSKVRPHRACIW